MIVSRHINSVFNSLSFRISDILIDPGDEWPGFENITAVLMTHVHFDHIYGLNRVIELNPKLRIYTNDFGARALTDTRLNMSKYYDSPFVLSDSTRITVVRDREEVSVSDGFKVKAIFTPGHNPSCITWIVGDSIFTGDSYIPGIKVVTNLPFANKQQAVESVEKIHNLSNNKTIYPGHIIC